MDFNVKPMSMSLMEDIFSAYKFQIGLIMDETWIISENHWIVCLETISKHTLFKYMFPWLLKEIEKSFLAPFSLLQSNSSPFI